MALDMRGKFFMSDVYGDIGYGTTELTIPEAADKQALVDDHDANATTEQATVNTGGIIGAIVLIVCVALFMGVVK